MHSQSCEIASAKVVLFSNLCKGLIRAYLTEQTIVYHDYPIKVKAKQNNTSSVSKREHKQ